MDENQNIIQSSQWFGKREKNMKYFGEGLSEKHKDLNRMIRNREKLRKQRNYFWKSMKICFLRKWQAEVRMKWTVYSGI